MVLQVRLCSIIAIFRPPLEQLPILFQKSTRIFSVSIQKGLLSYIHGRILLFYHKVQVYKMPNYIKVYGGCFEFTVVPLGFRGSWLLRKWPYFSAKKIDLMIYAKPRLEACKDVEPLRINWELSKVGNKELIQSDNTLLSKSYPANQPLGGQINFRYLIGKGEYVLKVKATFGEEVILEWEEIFTFELHSSDAVTLIILSAIAGAGIVLLIQWITDLMVAR